MFQASHNNMPRHKGIHTRTQREQKIGVSIKREKIEKMMTIIQI